MTAPSARAQVVAVAHRTPSVAELSDVPTACRALELRGDVDVDVEFEALRRRFDVLIRDPGPGAEPTRRIETLRRFDLVVLRPGDLNPRVLAAVAPERRLLADHLPATADGRAPDPAALRRRLDRLLAIPARLYRLTAEASRPAEALPLLRLLKDLDRDDVAAFSLGPAGFWSRLPAARFGAPWVWGPLVPKDSASEVSARRLVTDYDLPRLRQGEDIYGWVGGFSLASLSPRLHQRAYARLGIDSFYLPFPCATFDEFFLPLVAEGGLEGLGLIPTGFTVVAPHKEAALRFAEPGGFGAEVVRRTGGGNMMARNGHRWHVGSSDAAGVLEPLARRGIEIDQAQIAVLGIGGTGRAAADALRHAGARVTLINRTATRGREVADRIGTDFVALDAFRAGDRPWRVLVNATPLDPDRVEPIVDPSDLPAGATVMEFAYGDKPTPLITAARAAGLDVVDGHEMLLTQSRRQVEFLTGHTIGPDLLNEFIAAG